MKKQILMLLGLVAILSSCSNYNYYAVSNKKLNPGYRSYAWLPEGKSKASSIYDNDIVADKIVEAANAELNKRGFTLNNKRPDVLVSYTAVVNKEAKAYDDFN